MNQLPKWIYGQITYDDQKQAYVFVENNAIVPLENNMYIFYHEPTKRSFQYNQNTKQFKQMSLHEYGWSMRHFLCQDMIFHRITGVNYSDRKRQPPPN